MDIKQIDNGQFIVKKTDNMNTNARLFLTKDLIKDIEDEAIKQLTNVATLPGIVGDALAMPDMHSGYGFPIGGVAAFDYKTGIVSPGGIGFDIGCGIRLLTSDKEIDDIESLKSNILNDLFDKVPSGVGSETDVKVDRNEFLELVQNGIDWAIKQGIAKKEDKDSIEDYGKLDGSIKNLSQRAISRGRAQIGTLGSGNHFLEVQYVDSILDKQISKDWGLKEKQVVIMIHTGSRGFGHQIATDYIKTFLEKNSIYNINLVDPQLACVPIQSDIGQNYIQNMNLAVNFAYVNRQMITHNTREIFAKYGVNLDILYDVTHNVAKKESYLVDGKLREVFVHRKGATRAFSKGNKLLPSRYLNTGQPVIIPGSMGSYSYVLVGDRAEELSFGSVSHGAGRTMSRSEALKTLSLEQVSKQMDDHGVSLKTASNKGIVEEAKDVYKDVSEVVNALQTNHLAKGVARLRPVMVIKG